MKPHFDICVFGAGPAGSVMAKRLAQLGYSVVLVEKEPFPRAHIGLSLSPGIHHWLKLLEVKAQVEQAAFPRAMTSFVLWENEEMIQKDFDAEKAGYHVDRGRFDQILLESALAEGVKLMQPCHLNQLQKKPSGEWNISLNHSSGKKSISSQFIVEATGRKSIFKNSKKPYLPSTMATFAYWKMDRGKAPFSFIEAGEHEWFWGAPIGKDQLMTCVFSDPKAFKWFPSLPECFRNRISGSTLFSSFPLKNPISQVSVCPATAFVDQDPVSENFIKIGDAAFTMDPLSSQGVQKAIKTAFQGAIVVNTILQKENSEAALGYYRSLIKREKDNNAQWTRQFYNRQKRFEGSPFWNLRKDPSVPEQEEGPKIKVAIRKEDVLWINRQIIFKKVPVVGADFIQFNEAVIVNGQEEPLVFVQNFPIVPLIKAMHGRPLLEGLNVIYHRVPGSDPLKILKWLLYNRILNPNSP